MKIMDYLNEEWVIPDLKGADKPSILKELSGVLVKPCQVSSAEELVQVLLDREKLGSTGIGEGIARVPPDGDHRQTCAPASARASSPPAVSGAR